MSVERGHRAPPPRRPDARRAGAPSRRLQSRSKPSVSSWIGWLTRLASNQSGTSDPSQTSTTSTSNVRVKPRRRSSDSLDSTIARATPSSAESASMRNRTEVPAIALDPLLDAAQIVELAAGRPGQTKALGVAACPRRHEPRPARPTPGPPCGGSAGPRPESASSRSVSRSRW